MDICEVEVYKPVPELIAFETDYIRVCIVEPETLTYNVLPADAIYTATWSSDDEDIAAVSQSGEITPKAVGTTTVRVKTDNGKEATCSVEVWKPVPTKINLSETEIHLQAYKTATITYTVEPANAIYTADWLSYNENVATITQDGVIEAKGEGTTHVRIRTDNGKEAVCKVVVAPQPKSVKITPSSVVLERYRQQQLEYAFTPASALADYTWSSSNTSVATVSGDGLVTARYPGTANITITTDNGKTATCKVTVSKPAYQMFVYDKTGFKEGYKAAEHPTIWFNSSGQLLMWTKSEGTVLLDTAQVDCFTLERIWPEDPADIDIGQDIVLGLGRSAPVDVQLTPTDAKTTLEWFSSDENVVKVSAGGVLTALKEGIAAVTVQTANGLHKTTTVMVPHPQPTLYIYNKDGSSLGYRLAEHPDVQIGQTVFTLHTDRTTVQFAANEVWKFTIEDGDEHDLITGASDMEISPAPRPQFNAGEFTMEGYPSGCQVRVYDANGRLVRTYTVGNSGTLAFSVADLPAGLYIVKTESLTYKIIKQ